MQSKLKVTINICVIQSLLLGKLFPQKDVNLKALL